LSISGRTRRLKASFIEERLLIMGRAGARFCPFLHGK